MNENKNRKIIQIMPASGIMALFADVEKDTWFPCHLAYWGLMKNGGVVGVVLDDEMSGETSICEQMDSFIGYIQGDIFPDKEEMKIRISVSKEVAEENQKEREEHWEKWTKKQNSFFIKLLRHLRRWAENEA